MSRRVGILTIDDRPEHEICARRGCRSDALPDHNLCEPHRIDQRQRTRVSMRKARQARDQLWLFTLPTDRSYC